MHNCNEHFKVDNLIILDYKNSFLKSLIKAGLFVFQEY